MKAYIDLDVFDDWLWDVFIPDLIAKCEHFSYHRPALD
jgi:hypothetical protein